MPTWLSPAGVASALVIGVAAWLGTDWRGVALLFVFLITSSLLTPGGGRRRPAQVFANGGAAAACALLAMWNGAFSVAFAGAVAAAAADTWSTEIGGRSRTAPRLITTGRAVERGVSGGITFRGLVGGAAGGALIAAAAWYLQLAPPRLVVWIAIGGVAGMLIDSLLGAALQARWRCERCGALIETRNHDGCGGSGAPASGLRFLNNDAVNFVSTSAGAAVAALPMLLRGAILP